MANRELKTKIKLRYDLLANWTAKNPELLAGEIAIVAIPSGVTEMQVDGSQPNPPQILFKVGPGKFNDLSYASAKAADVYGWAKAASKPTYTKAEVGLGNVANVESYSKTEVDNKISEIQGALEADTNTTYRFDFSEGNKLGIYKKDIGGEEVKVGDFAVDFTAIENAISLKADKTELNNYYTKTEADGKFLTSHQDISGKADKSYVDEELGKKANTTYVNDELAKKVDLETYNGRVTAVDNRFSGIDGKILDIEGGIEDINEELGLIGDYIEDINDELALKAVKSEVETALAGKVDNATLEGYYKKGEIDTAVNGLDSRITANAKAIEALTNGTSAEEIDSVMDLIDYVNKHGTEVQGMKDDIKANADDIDALEGRATAVEGDIKTLKEETIPGLSSRIKDYEDNKGGFALKTELFSGSYKDLKDTPDLTVYETIANVDKVREDVAAIKGDYLKASDKTELSNAIATEKGRVDTLVNTTVPGIDGRVAALEAKPFDTYATKSAVEAVDGKADGIDNRLKAVEGDYLKGSDKTTLENAISTAVAGEKSRAEAAEKGLGDRLTAVETNYLSSADVIIWDCGGAN